MNGVSETIPIAAARPTIDGDLARIRRQNVVQLGLWIFLATVVMLFAAFSSAYIVRRAGADWRQITLPPLLWLNTSLLVASSVAVEVSRAQGNKSRWGPARGALLGAVLLGVSFLVGQLVVWQRLVTVGVYVPTSPHASFFYILTGLHGVHLLAGLILLLYTVGHIGNVKGHGDALDWRALMGLSATFWHFFGVLWLYLFAMLAVA